jgi:LmbE family N-acetylglucosaminyl deacetylase
VSAAAPAREGTATGSEVATEEGANPVPRWPASALAIVAHPDDVDFGAAGTIAEMVRAGTSVAYCVVTDGQAGGSDPTVDRSKIAGIRRSEQRAAARVLGVDEIHFLGYPDGQVVVSTQLRQDLARVIRLVRPGVVLTQSPVRDFGRIFASHPDHLAAGEAAVCAAYPDARNPFAHPELLDEGLEPHSVKELWLMASPRPNRAVDITESFGKKLEALRRHVSQVGHEEDLEGRLRGWASAGASLAGLPSGSLAEVFQVVTMPASGSS